MAVASAEPNQAGKLLTLGKELLESSKYFHFFFLDMLYIIQGKKSSFQVLLEKWADVLIWLLFLFQFKIHGQ